MCCHGNFDICLIYVVLMVVFLPATPFNNNEEVFSYFKQLLIKHSLQRPPYSVGVFTVNHVQVNFYYSQSREADST